MNAIYVSDKGQVTLPVKVRKRLGIKPKSKIDIEVRDNEIILKPIRSIKDVKGIFKGITKGETKDWETIRQEVEESVAREVICEDL